MSRARSTPARPLGRDGAATLGLGICLLCLLAAAPVVGGALTGSVDERLLGYLVPVMTAGLLVGVAAFSVAN